MSEFDPRVIDANRLSERDFGELVARGLMGPLTHEVLNDPQGKDPRFVTKVLFDAGVITVDDVLGKSTARLDAARSLYVSEWMSHQVTLVQEPMEEMDPDKRVFVMRINGNVQRQRTEEELAMEKVGFRLADVGMVKLLAETDALVSMVGEGSTPMIRRNKFPAVLVPVYGSKPDIAAKIDTAALGEVVDR